MQRLSNPDSEIAPISSAKKRSYIIGKLIETDYFESNGNDLLGWTIFHRPWLKMLGFSISLSWERTLAGTCFSY